MDGIEVVLKFGGMEMGEFGVGGTWKFGCEGGYLFHVWPRCHPYLWRMCHHHGLAWLGARWATDTYTSPKGPIMFFTYMYNYIYILIHFIFHTKSSKSIGHPWSPYNAFHTSTFSIWWQLGILCLLMYWDVYLLSTSHIPDHPFNTYRFFRYLDWTINY